VQRFREAFSRARWRPEEGCWFVPGTTAARRLDQWVARELESLDRHADAKGRDAFAFEPLHSPYLEVGQDLAVRTPYSRTVVEEMRAIPWARWDPEERVWRIPFRSWEDLRVRWPVIEAAARRNEPEARRQRRQAAPNRDAGWLRSERRRRRYPVLAQDLPPLGRPVSTVPFGVVVFEDITGELAGDAARRYPHVQAEPADYIWAHWRLPVPREIYAARRTLSSDAARPEPARGWWLPDRAALDERLRTLRAMDRARASRQGTGPNHA
jgi:hypothetical protein